MSPTIFNMVAYAVVWHWVELMVEGAGRREDTKTPFYTRMAA